MMKTAKEFFERYDLDERFCKEVNATIKTLKAGGADNLFTAAVQAAGSLGYTVTEEEVKAFRMKQSSELSDELLESVSGGTEYWGNCYKIQKNEC